MKDDAANFEGYLSDDFTPTDEEIQQFIDYKDAIDPDDSGSRGSIKIGTKTGDVMTLFLT